MKALHLPAVNRAMLVLLVLAAASTTAQPSPVGVISNPPPPHHGGMHGFHRPFIIVERETVIEREVEPKPPPPPAPTPPPPPPRKPYVIGRSYASLPGGCMKMIERGAAYFLCSGEWYRKVGGGAQYKAVAKP
jgi:hypothetical protein